MGSDGTRGSRSTPRLDIAVTDEYGGPVKAAGLGRWLLGTAPSRAAGSLAVAIASDATVRRLNRRYRRKDRPTDVLAFPYEEGSSARPGRRRSVRHLGDIVIARGVAARQARAHGHSMAAELRVLALHGLLHLLGYDHERDNGEMARLEARLLRRPSAEGHGKGRLRRPVLDTREGYRPSASGVGVGPHASKR
jgi:probable rRNA maturation factor